MFGPSNVLVVDGFQHAFRQRRVVNVGREVLEVERMRVTGVCRIAVIFLLIVEESLGRDGAVVVQGGRWQVEGESSCFNALCRFG